MKKLFLFITIAVGTLTASAQQLYNGSFEQWSYFTNPDGWGTWASAVSQYNTNLGDSIARLTVRDSLTHANYPDDTISVRMVVDTITFPGTTSTATLAGFISLGGAFYIPPPDTAPGLYYGYYPYTAFPDSMIFDYKYVPAAGYNDSALVIMTMMRFDSLSQTEKFYLSASWLLNPVDSWTHISLPLTTQYLLHDTFHSDSIQVIIISSIAGQPHRGTTLWIDSIHFDASVDILDTPVGINNIVSIQGIKAYPNPANGELNILVQSSEVGSVLQLYDASGRLAYHSIISQQESIIDTKGLPDGQYSMQIHSRDRLTIYRGKFNVMHRE